MSSIQHQYGKSSQFSLPKSVFHKENDIEMLQTQHSAFTDANDTYYEST
jgi:hypothetical protein